METKNKNYSKYNNMTDSVIKNNKLFIKPDLKQEQERKKNPNSKEMSKKKDDKKSNNQVAYKQDKKDKSFSCPFCLANSSRDSNNKEPISIKQTTDCEKCKKRIKFLCCAHCNREIYYENQEFKLGINMNCPYIECNKDFSFTICGGCKKYIAIKEKFIEGNPIKCPYENCQVTSSIVLCPYLDCECPNSFLEKKYFEGYPISCINSRCKRIFSKFNCNFCFRRFFLDEKECKNYSEGMKILCPYDDCRKSFNKFYCACCQRINIIENSFYKKMCGKNFNYFICAYEDCLKTFLKINCPKCLFVNEYIGKNNLEGKNLTCDNPKCNYSYTFSYCGDCDGLNIWEAKENETHKKYVRGQDFTCKNKKCNKKICKINCPYCYQNKELIVCSKEKKRFGQTLICENKNCNKKFYHLYCPSCRCTKIKKEERKDILELIECPKCGINDIEFSVFNQYKKFNFLNCPKCLENFYYLESDLNDRASYFKCPYSNCISYLSESDQLSIRINNNEIDLNQMVKGRIHEFSNPDFYIDLKDTLEFQIIITEFLFAEELKIKTDELKTVYQVPFKNEPRIGNPSEYQDCNICIESKSDIIFAPCGHSHTCSPCYKQLNDKKCPVCKQKIESVINKNEIA